MSKINFVNNQAPALNAETLNKLQDNIIDTIYPVGSIYMSVNSTSPATLFGGTWEALENRMLIGAGDSYTAGTTGGSATHTPSGTVGGHTLTVNEIPAHSHGLNSHTHTYAKSNANTGSHVLTGAEMPKHTHQLYFADNNSSSQHDVAMYDGYKKSKMSGDFIAYSGENKGHSHTISTTNTNTGGASGNTTNTGGSGSHNHGFTGTSQNTMPPYLTVYMWKRTA